MRTGFAHLPLHGGRAPPWLFQRMVPLSREIVTFIAAQFGREEVLRRLSDPFWFQAFGCVLGFDWHSSGLTTTVCGALKEGLRGTERELGIYVAGGKGATSRKTPAEITTACERLGRDPQPLVYASKISAKVDNSAVQDGYQLYQHSFVFTGEGKWCIVQQGMSDETSMARRYHWLSDDVQSYVNEPHAAVCCDQTGETLNLVAAENAPVRHAAATLAREKPEVVLLEMPRHHAVTAADVDSKYLRKILLRTYENPPADFEALLATPGVGAKTLRALALTSELVYGTQASFRDPARYSFAHGGKDGTPFPVDRATYDKTIEVMEKALNRAHVARTEKVHAFRRLAQFAASSSGNVSPKRETPMKKQAGISTVAAAVIAAGAVGGAMAALALWQFQNLMHVRAQLNEAQAQIETANASANAARTQLNAIRKELDERRMDFDQMRAERDSAKNLLDAERQHTERIHAELNLAREQLALLSSRRTSAAAYPAPQLVRPQVLRVAPASGGRAVSRGAMAPAPAER